MAVTSDQGETITFLRAQLAARGCALREIVTHGSRVFLTSDRAYKLKLAVRFPFLDFSTPERRLRFCRAELALNRRTAPKLYVDVHTITRDADGALALNGAGQLVDAVVEMRRFRDQDLFENLAKRGELTPELMADLARKIAGFHRSAEVSNNHGGFHAIARVIELNDRALREGSFFPVRQIDRLTGAFREALQGHQSLVEARQKAGKVRRCHGDLILRNICLLEGEPTLFDCLEFDEDLAIIDVLYDIAFLLMDLWHSREFDLANLVLNRYLDETDEEDGLGLLPFFMALRAVVRAHVTAVQAHESSSDSSASLRAEAFAFFELADNLLTPKAPILVAVGGLSRSGKSTAAAAIASSVGAAPGARILASDRIRKALHGVAPETRLPETAYRPEASKHVYAVLRQKTRHALMVGSAVVADAVFDRPLERDAIESVGRAAGVFFVGFWLTAPINALADRVESRKKDASDATGAVLLAQAAQDCGEITWRRVNAGGNTQQTRDTIISSLEAVAGPGDSHVVMSEYAQSPRFLRSQ